MLCQMVPQQATAPLDTSSTSWQYHPAGIDTSRRFLTVSTRQAYFQDSRPQPDAVLVTVLFETSTPIRCSLLPTPLEPAREEERPTNSDTLADHITTLPLWERDLIAPAMEGFLPDSSLYEVLHKRNVNILVASDGGHVDAYGSFGWLIGKQAEIIWDCQGIARGYPMQSYRAEGYGRMSLLLFLNHYIHYHGIQPAEDLRVTSYCDNSSLLETKEEFHNRDVDSTSWYLKPDHDVIMTLNEIRKKLPFTLITRHVKGHQDDEREYDDLNKPREGRKSCALPLDTNEKNSSTVATSIEDSPTVALPSTSSSRSSTTPQTPTSQSTICMTPQYREHKAREWIIDKAFDFTYNELDEEGQLRVKRLMSSDFCWTLTRDCLPKQELNRGETTFRREFDDFCQHTPGGHAWIDCGLVGTCYMHACVIF
jgi:hypothetical protein